MSSPPRKRVRNSEDLPSVSGIMIQEDAGSKPRSPSGERRNKKAMKIQPGQRSSPSSSSSPGRRGGQSEEDSETEGEFSPANSGVDPNFLRKIQKSTELSKIDQEVSEGGSGDGGA